MISIIVCIAENRAIGFKNKLLYWLPNDLKRFKQLTTGHTIIMGRNTFESLPKGALPNRRNIVLSRNVEIEFPGAEHYISLEEALRCCKEEEEVYIIGGASVYEQALSCADRILVTHVDNVPQEADTFFPLIDRSVWEEVSREEHPADEKHLYSYAFVDYERKRK